MTSLLLTLARDDLAAALASLPAAPPPTWQGGAARACDADLACAHADGAGLVALLDEAAEAVAAFDSGTQMCLAAG